MIRIISTITIFIINIITSYHANLVHATHCSVTYLYQSIQNKLHKTDYRGAIQNLTKLQNLHLFDPYPQYIYLNLIYSHYKLHNLISANDLIQKFLKLYPNHKYLDYVLYMHGIINMSLDKHNAMLIKYLQINWYEHHPQYAYVAFHSFIQLIHNYPNSQYSADAQKRLIFLKNRIAKYELSIVKFYHKKNAYISVAARSEKILFYFPDTQAAYQALYYLQEAYQKLHLVDQANKIKQIININAKY